MNTSKVLTFEEWIKMIRSQATSISQQINEISIHQEKLSTLIKQLRVFNQKTAPPLKFPDTTPNASETDALRSVMSLLSSLTNLIDSCKEAKMIDTLTYKSTDYVNEFLTNFRRDFGRFLLNFKILSQNIFITDSLQSQKDDYFDSKEIVDVIDVYLQRQTLCLFENKLKKKREQYQEIVDELEVEIGIDEDDKNRPVSQAEYQKRIQEISDCFVDRNDFEKNKKLGQGSFGMVFSGIQKSTSKVVAIKELFLTNIKAGDLKSLIYEVGIMSKIRHYGILPLIGYIPDSPYTIITEFMSGGTLDDRIFNSKLKPLGGTKLTIIALGVAYTMKFMHNNKYYHRDLKPENIILDADDYPYIIDFGLSRRAPEDESQLMTNQIGTLAFMAPELMEDVPYDGKVDVYAYAVTLWIMLTGQKPYKNLNQMQLMMRVSSGQRPSIPADAGQMGVLIEKCWNQDPKKRPSFDTIVSILETGQVVFPGTNNAQLTSYMNIYKKKSEMKQDVISPKKKEEEVKTTPKVKAENVDIKDLLKMMTKDKTVADAIDIIAPNVTNESFMKKLLKSSRFLPSLLNASDYCESLEEARKIIIIFTGILKINNELSEALIQIVLGLFVRFGSTEMTEILIFIDSLPPKVLAKIKLSVNQLNKFASFLKHSNLSLRTTATNILIKIIQNKSYVAVISLDSNLREVMSNIASSVSSMPDLLFASLTVANLLLPFSELDEIFIKGEIFASTVSVFNYKQLARPEIFATACEILRTVINKFKGKVTQNDIKVALHSLKSAATTVCGNQQVNYISTFVKLLELNVLYEFIERQFDNDIVSCIETYLLNGKSEDAIVLLLKFCYSLLADQNTHNYLSRIGSSCYLKLITNPTSTAALGRLNQSEKVIQSVASCCLIQSLNDNNIDKILTNELKGFIKRSLKSMNVNDESTINALRICSALSCRRKGAEFLMEGTDFTQLIDFYLGCGDKMLFRLAVMTYSSISAVFPGSEKMISNVPKYLDMLNDKDYEELLPYISSFLANATVCSEAAVECANRISVIAKSLLNLCSTAPILKKTPANLQIKKNKFYIIYKLVKTLTNIVICPKALSSINNSEHFTTVYKAAKQPFCDQLLGVFLELFVRISRTKYGNEAYKNSKFGAFLKTKMQRLKPEDYRRALILRLQALNP